MSTRPLVGSNEGGSVLLDVQAMATWNVVIRPSKRCKNIHPHGRSRKACLVTSRHVHGSEEARKAVQKGWEAAERTMAKRIVCAGDFLTPPRAKLAKEWIEKRSDAKVWFCGGHVHAERKRLIVGHPSKFPRNQDERAKDRFVQEYVGAVRARGDLKKLKNPHRSALGSVLGAGLDRNKVGDVWVHPEQQQVDVVVAATLLPYLCNHLKRIGRVEVQVEPIPLDLLEIPEPVVELKQSVEASTRIDAIASTAFQMSRSKAIEMVKSGDVRVNWEAVEKGMTKLEAGDVISIAGQGRAHLLNVEPISKGKYFITVERYL